MATAEQPGRVHTVAIGASAGGIEALRNLVAELPPDLSAAVVVVLHMPPRGTSVLPQILSRAGALPAVQAQDGMPTKGGTIFVAPPDSHLLVHDGTLRLDHGPRVNGHRPAVDPLFRSLARAYGTRGAAVVLSGVLDDGTAGLMAVKRAGGATLAQDPREALYDGMPRSAIEIVLPGTVATAAQLGRAIGELVLGRPPEPQDAPRPPRSEIFVEVDRGSSDDPQPGTPTGLTCPECNGAIWMDDREGVVRFACRTGHEYAPETFEAVQADRVEAALFTALRTLEERAALYRRMAERHRAGGNVRTAERFSLRAEGAVQHAFTLREVIEQLNAGTREEGAA